MLISNKIQKRKFKNQNYSTRVKVIFLAAAVVLLSSSLTVAQYVDSSGTKTATAQSQFRFGRLELATILDISSIRFSTAPLFQYARADTMVVDTNAGDSTMQLVHNLLSDSAVDTNTILIKQKSALAAVLMSAIIPGGGQIYNGSYWKVPIVVGAQVFLITQWISNNKTYQSLRSQYADSLGTAGPPSSWSPQERRYLSDLQQERDSFHDQRDSYAWYIAGIYFLSMLDAYVDAELSGFDVSPSLGVNPAGSTSFALSFSVKF